MTGATGLALDFYRTNAFNLDLEKRLDGSLDFALVRVGSDLEHYLTGAFGNHCRFFGDVWPQDHLENALVIHARSSSIFLRAGTVTSTFSKRIRLTGSIPSTSRTSTLCRLRDER